LDVLWQLDTFRTEDLFISLQICRVKLQQELVVFKRFLAIACLLMEVAIVLRLLNIIADNCVMTGQKLKSLFVLALLLQNAASEKHCFRHLVLLHNLLVIIVELEQRLNGVHCGFVVFVEI